MRFTLEFPAPSRDAILAIPCNYCGATASERCYRQNWQKTRKTFISSFHQDREAAAVGLEVVASSSVYRIKP